MKCKFVYIVDYEGAGEDKLDLLEPYILYTTKVRKDLVHFCMQCLTMRGHSLVHSQRHSWRWVVSIQSTGVHLRGACTYSRLHNTKLRELGYNKICSNTSNRNHIKATTLN